MKDLEDKSNLIHDMANDFEGEPFIGPHDIVIDQKGSKLKERPKFMFSDEFSCRYALFH